MLQTVHEYQAQLDGLWKQANASNERLVAELREWCARAEASGIAALEEFSARLRGLPAAADAGLISGQPPAGAKKTRRRRVFLCRG